MRLANNFNRMQDNRQTIHNCLTDLGLSDREAKVYLALLRKRTANSSELQRLSDVPQSKIYETLNNLVRQGLFIERREGHKRLFEIIDPKIALDTPFQNLAKRLDNSLRSRKKIEELFENNEHPIKPFEYLEIIHGNENIHTHFLKVIGSASKEFLCLNRPPYAFYNKSMSREQYRAYIGFIKRGGKSQFIYDSDEESLKLAYERSQYESLKNEDFRITYKLPLKLMIFDRETLLLADEGLFANTGELSISIIKQTTTVNGFFALFEYLWVNAYKYDEWSRLHGSKKAKGK